MEHQSPASCLEEWNTLEDEFKQLEDVHKQYLQRLEELQQFQQKCIKGIAHQKYRMSIMSKSLQKLCKATVENHEDQQKLQRLDKEIIKRNVKLSDMEENLPHKSGRYLRIILGGVNVSLMNKTDRYTYKDEYEKFKLIVTFIAFVISFTNLVIVNYRFLDLVFLFLLVWYYCTLTIRESILKVNGSKIKGWWRTHHFLSTVAAAILLIWPDGSCYQMFRKQFGIFNCYIAVVQFLQFRYQQGTLYRLKALGERHNMDITIEGFHSWMWRGLSFLLPFLYIGYGFQLYNAYTLYIMNSQSLCSEWQIPALSALFFVIFLGNIITTSMVIPQKLKSKLLLKYRLSQLMKKKRLNWSAEKHEASTTNTSEPASPKKDA